jgi:hypothetical protein
MSIFKGTLQALGTGGRRTVIEARRSAGLWSSPSSVAPDFLPLPRLDGVISARCLLFAWAAFRKIHHGIGSGSLWVWVSAPPVWQ